VELLFERRVKGNSVRIEKTRVGNGRKLDEGIDANSQLVIDPRCQPFTYKDRQRDLFPLVIFFSYVRGRRNQKKLLGKCGKAVVMRLLGTLGDE
jgi:hypothetical protein